MIGSPYSPVSQYALSFDSLFSHPNPGSHSAGAPDSLSNAVSTPLPTTRNKSNSCVIDTGKELDKPLNALLDVDQTKIAPT